MGEVLKSSLKKEEIIPPIKSVSFSEVISVKEIHPHPIDVENNSVESDNKHKQTNETPLKEEELTNILTNGEASLHLSTNNCLLIEQQLKIAQEKKSIGDMKGLEETYKQLDIYYKQLKDSLITSNKEIVSNPVFQMIEIYEKQSYLYPRKKIKSNSNYTEFISISYIILGFILLFFFLILQLL